MDSLVTWGPTRVLERSPLEQICIK